MCFCNNYDKSYTTTWRAASENSWFSHVFILKWSEQRRGGSILKDSDPGLASHMHEEDSYSDCGGRWTLNRDRLSVKHRSLTGFLGWIKTDISAIKIPFVYSFHSLKYLIAIIASGISSNEISNSCIIDVLSCFLVSHFHGIK